jgi:glycosyltransferase involved in cell wall biosynthesis
MVAYTFYASDPRVRREAEALASRGDDVHFICVRDEKVAGARKLNGVRLYPLGVGRYQGGSALQYLLKYAVFFIKATIWLTALFAKYRYSVIQVHTMPDFLVFTALIPRLFGAKVILDVHDLMPELYICKFRSGPDHIVVRLITWIERLSIAFAHHALAVHIPHREALVAHGNSAEKLSVLMNVPDPRIFKRSAEPVSHDGKRFRLVYHGTVAQRHGLHVALRAVIALKSRIPELEFLIIGHGDDLQRTRDFARDNALNGCVRFLERMPVERLPEHLMQADVGVIPLCYDEFTRYMLPLKLMEYVRLDIPVIVSRTETIQAYFDDRMVRYVKPGDDRELADAIWELYENPDRRRQLTGHARKFNAAYNWEGQKETYFALIDALTRKKV